MCELDKKKLKDMIDSCLKGELLLDKKAFKTLTMAYENSVNFVEQPVMVHPSTLRPPPIVRITKTTTITTTIEAPSFKGDAKDFGGCVNELEKIFESGEKYLQKANDAGLGIKTDKELKLILDANEMVLARD